MSSSYEISLDLLLRVTTESILSLLACASDSAGSCAAWPEPPEREARERGA
jgi:hypothetical protein